MRTVAVRRVKDLDEPIRRWIASMFGRELQEEEQITITVFPPHSAPAAAVRQKAATHMDRILDKAAENMRDLPDQEFEGAVEEAMQQVRRWQS